MKPENNREVDIVVYPQYNYHAPLDQYNQTISYREKLKNLFENGTIRWTQYWNESGRLQDLQNMVGRKLAEELITKYKGTKFDPTYMWTPGGGFRIVDADPNWVRNEIIKYHTREEDTGVKDWFKSYVTSPGYEHIIKNQKALLGNAEGAHSLRSAVLNNIDNKKLFYSTDGPDYSVAQPFLDRAYIKTWRSNKGDNEHPKAEVEAHELAHLITTPFYNDIIVPQKEMLNKNTNTAEGHDSRLDEKHADIWGLKYLLYKEDIHDVRKGPVTKEHVKELRKRYPELRQLKQMNDEKATWMLNHVAQNTNNPYSDPNRARV